MTKRVVIIGGGKSVRTGIESSLWDKIKNEEVWGLNYAYKLYPYKLDRQLFVDFNFFRNNQNDMENLAKQGIPIHAKSHSKLRDVTNGYITQYNTIRERGGFKGKNTLKTPEPHIFVGRLGLVGTFALSLAIAEGYDEIFLLGYDFGPPSVEDKDTHWYQKEINVKSTGVGRPTVYWEPNAKIKKQIQDYQVFVNIPGVNIYNVSLISNITYLPKISYSLFYYLLKEGKENETPRYYNPNKK